MKKADLQECLSSAEDRDAEILDELIHETYSNMASAINNLGVEAQIRSLLEAGTPKTTILETLQYSPKEDPKHTCPACGVRVYTRSPMPEDARREELLCDSCYLTARSS